MQIRDQIVPDAWRQMKTSFRLLLAPVYTPQSVFAFGLRHGLGSKRLRCTACRISVVPGH